MSDVGGDALAKLLLAQELGCAQALLGEDAEEVFDLVVAFEVAPDTRSRLSTSS